MTTKLNTKQIVEVSNIIREHIRHLPDGLVEYTDGMTDKKIAKLAGVGYWHVLNVRRQAFGDMSRGRKPEEEETAVQEQVLDLQMRLARIESFMVQDWGYELSPAHKSNGEDA